MADTDWAAWSAEYQRGVTAMITAGQRYVDAGGNAVMQARVNIVFPEAA